MLLNAATILSRVDLKQERVEVPEWGGYVFVRTMTGDEREGFELEHIAQGKEKSQLKARLLVRTVCDEVGVPLFTKDQVAALSAKNSVPIDRLAEVSMRLNALTGEASEEMAKN
jgi:hypothetical protein